MKFLFILLCLFILLRLIFKPVLRLVIQLVVNKMMNKQQGTFYRTYNTKRKAEGTIDVDYVPPHKGKGPAPSKDTGEYVDFEEVK
jgi:hypothetical protein